MKLILSFLLFLVPLNVHEKGEPSYTYEPYQITTDLKALPMKWINLTKLGE